MATKPKKTAAPRKLSRVRPGFYLHWPPELKNPNSPEGSGRGGPGYIVDLNLPFEHEWCAGQMHKLEAIAPRDQVGLEASSISDCPGAVFARMKAIGELKEEKKPTPVAEAKESTAAAGADVKADGAMLPMADDDEPMDPEG